MFKTEFDFALPKGYLDGEGNLHRKGIMRMAKAIDEIVPMRDPRVKSNAAYATVLILARVVTSLGALDEVNPRVIEELYACDLNYLYDLYQEINGSPEAKAQANVDPTKAISDAQPDVQSEGAMAEDAMGTGAQVDGESVVPAETAEALQPA